MTKLLSLLEGASQEWVLSRERLDALADIDVPDFNAANKKRLEGKLDPLESIYRVEDGVAVIDVVGDIFKTTPWIYQALGIPAASTAKIGEALDWAMSEGGVKAILLHVDSPGGQVSGVAALADHVYDLARTGEKPVHAYISDCGTSAAYWIASQASRLTAGQTARVGSIGVYSVIFDRSKQAEDMGVKVHVVGSGEHKGAGVPGSVVSAEQLAAMRETVQALADIFAADVERGRKFTCADEADEVLSGRVWMAGRAKELGLLDGVESSGDAIWSVRGAASARDPKMRAHIAAAATKAADVAKEKADNWMSKVKSYQHAHRCSFGEARKAIDSRDDGRSHHAWLKEQAGLHAEIARTQSEIEAAQRTRAKMLADPEVSRLVAAKNLNPWLAACRAVQSEKKCTFMVACRIVDAKDDGALHQGYVEAANKKEK